MRRTLIALALAAAVATSAAPLLAQEHAYTPDEAHLLLATEKWLVWLPDDEGKSLDAPKEDEEETEEAGGEEEAGEGDDEEIVPGLEKFKVPPPPKLELPKLPDPEKFERIFVVQAADDQSKLRKVVATWKPASGDIPRIPDPVTVLDNGTLVTTDLERFTLTHHPPDGEAFQDSCFAKGKAGTLVEAYPDGIVVQVPGPDRIRLDRRADRSFKQINLYWVPLGESSFADKKVTKMTFAKISTQWLLRVARFEDRIALPGYVFNLKNKKRKKFDFQSSEPIDAFDGNVATSGRFSHAVREKDKNRAPGDQEFFVVRNGIGYWLDPGNRGLWRILAVRFSDREGKKLEVGRFPFAGDEWDLNRRHREGSTLAVEDLDSKQRMTIYWNSARIVWADGDSWSSRDWLVNEDFKQD